jgi:SNF2 family DNA or RNA helicase
MNKPGRPFEESLLTMEQNRLVYCGTAAQLRNCSKSIPIKYNDKTRYFEFPIFPTIAKHLEKIVPHMQIDVRLKKHLTSKSKQLSNFWDLKLSKDIKEDAPLKDVGLIDIKLFPHQKVSSRINELFTRVLCLDEMGLGKTIVALRSALYRKIFNKNKRCLIICPNSIRVTVWANEIKSRTGLGICVPDGTKIKREKLIKQFMDLNASNEAYHFMVINYEMTYKYLDLIKQFADDQMLIIDESHYMKNRLSQRTKAIFKINPKYLISMTGTPFDNKIEDIFALAEYVCPLIFSGSYTKFKDQYCIERTIPLKSKGRVIQRNVIAGYKNLAQLRATLGLISYRRTKKEVLDLPPKLYENRQIQMTVEQWKCYEKMRLECYVMVAKLDESQIEATAKGILAKMLRLSQITDGYLTDFADKSKTYWIKNSGKVAELDDLLEQIINSGHKAVVWSRFVEVVTHLTKRYKEKYGAVYINGQVPTSMRPEIIDRFQTDENTKVFVGQIQSCGVGMTLHAASYEIFFDKCFISSSGITQAEDRCHRIGMKDRLTIIHLIAKSTIDEYWEKNLKNKLQAVNEVTQDNQEQEYTVIPGKVTKGDLLDLLKIGKKGA